MPTVFLFFAVPALQGNSFTPADVFWLFPAFTVPVAVLAIVGTGLLCAQVLARFRSAVLGAKQTR